MKKPQDDDLKMINTSHECLLSNILAWGPNTIIQAKVDDLEQSNVYLHKQMMIQMRGSSDETVIKNEARALMETILIKVKNGEIAYSNSVKDRSGFVAINISNSDIKSLKDEEITVYADIVYDMAIDLGIKLPPYNIKPADTLLLKTKTDVYKGVLGGKRDVLTSVTVATANIEKELHRVKVMLREELDPLVETFIDVAPDFVNQYHSARKIVHYGVRHLAPECTINFGAKDSVSSEDLRLVHILVVETGDKALTDDTGAASLQLAKAGLYTVTFTKPNYKALTKTNVELGVGDILTLDVVLTLIVPLPIPIVVVPVEPPVS